MESKAMNEYEIIEQLEDLITDAKQSVFSEKVSVNRDEVLDLLYYLKSAIKQRDQEDQARDAEFIKIKQQSKQIKTEPIQTEPEEIQLDAALQVEDETITDAYKEAEQIMRSALAYADDLLASVQGKLSETLETIKQNRQELDQ